MLSILRYWQFISSYNSHINAFNMHDHILHPTQYLNLTITLLTINKW